MRTNKAFTLIEILVAVMLTGVLTTLALAPVVMTVSRVVDTQADYSDFAALSRTVNFIARDLNSAMRLSSNVVTIQDHEALGGYDDDVLLIMSTSPTIQNLPSGTLVYKIAEGGMMHQNYIPGLYRWIFPGKIPNMVKTDTLDIENAQLVLPYVKNFCVEIPYGSHSEERRKSYTGQLPAGIYIKITRGERTAYATMNNEDDERNEYETVIVFP